MYKIITNNKSVYEAFVDVQYVDGSFRDVLITARDAVHQGYSLSQHPLPASIRMLHSPYRTLIVCDNGDALESTMVIESAIEKYDVTMGRRVSDTVNAKDYQFLDFSLMQSAIDELANFIPKRR